MNERYAAIGPGYSGTTDDLNEAKAWVANANGEGAIYLRLDFTKPCPLCGGGDDADAGLCPWCDGKGEA